MRIALLGFIFAGLSAGGASALTQAAGADAAVVTAQAQSVSPAAGVSQPSSRPASAGKAPAAPKAAAPNRLPIEPAPQPSAGATVSTSPAGGVALPEIMRGTDAMPESVRATWNKLVEAAQSGDVERLRPIIDAQREPPSVAFQEIQDPIEYLKSLSGDAESREILAILLEVLEAGFVHVDAGTPQEMYVWPYFAQYPLDKLTPPQVVELFRLLTSADYDEMRSYGAYIFFRVGITPAGKWSFFVAGD